MSAIIDDVYSDDDYLPRRAIATKRRAKTTKFSWSRLNPIAYIARRRAHKKEIRSFTEAFEDRNPDTVIFPFMAALVNNEDYHLLPDNYLFVKEDLGFMEQLDKIGFVPSSDVFPDNGFFKDELERTDTITDRRYYHNDFNIEVHVVSVTDWQRLESAKKIVDDLKTDDDIYIDRFLCIAQSLFEISKDGLVV